MRQTFEFKGKNVDEKLKHAETILQRMSRRISNRSIGFVPASPIFGYVDDVVNDPVVIKTIFPADGTITKAAIFVEDVPKEGVLLHIELKNMKSLGYETHTLLVPKKGLLLDLNYAIKAGDMLTVTAEAPADGAVGLWVSMLYELSSMKKVKLVEEELDDN
jgi:hypothetical protein